MKKHVYFKRTLATFLAVLMLFAQVPVSVFAVEATPEAVETPEVGVTAPTGDLTLETGVTVTAKSLYSFTPSESGVYCFYSTVAGETDPKARLLDADKKQLAQDDDGGGNLNFEIHYELTAGTTYYLEADAYSNRFPYTLFVKASDISSIEIVSNPTYEVEEYDVEYGGWSTVYNGEIVDRYFMYYPYPAMREAVLRVNYKDGTSKEIGNVGEEPDFEGISFDWNFSENPWVVGTDNHYYITYKGLKVLANATVTKSPVTSIEVLEIEIPEFIEHDEASGDWTNYYQGIELEEEYFNYYISQAASSIKLLVTYEDNTTEEISYIDESGNSTGIRTYSDQYQQPWTVGENEFEIWYRGACTTATATVVESPVESIEVISGGDYEYTEFDENCGYWMYDETFYYYPDHVMQNVVLKVTNTDGTSETIPYRNEDGTYNGITYSDSQHETPWTVGGSNEIRIAYKGASTTLSATLKAGMVESISVEDVTVTEGTNGSFYQKNTSEGIDYWYHYEFYAESITVTVNFTDGTSFTGTQQELIENYNLSISFRFQEEQSYENQWGPGEYTVTASLLGKKAEFSYIIEESNIESIFVADVELEENVDGNWHEGYWGENGYVYAEWFRYEPAFKFQLTVTFKDGTVFTGTSDELSNAYDMYPEVLNNQSYTNQWQVGGTYSAKAFLCGKSADFSVTIGESNIKSIEVIDTQGFKYIENSTQYGYWDGDYFWYSPWELASKITIRVTYRDDTTEDIPYVDEFGNHNGISCFENQRETPWTVGGENYLTIVYQGARTTVPVIIEESPIASIVVAPMTFTEYTNGYWNNGGYWDENGEWVDAGEYFHYYIHPQFVTITYTDGTVISGTTDEIGNQTGFYPESNAHQGYDNQWGIGDHTATLTFMGTTVEYTITIEESDIASITAPDMTFIEGTGGWWNQYTDSEGAISRYYFYECYPNQVTITYKDGTVITGTFEEIFQQTGYYPEVFTDQDPVHPWGVGSHTATVSFMGANGDISVTIAPSPVESIVVEPVSYIEHTNGDWRMGGYWNEYGEWIELGEYYYYYANLNKITVTYSDGNVFTGTLDELIQETGYSVTVNSDQDYDNQWGIGTHAFTVSFMGKTTEVAVEIIVSPIQSVTVDTLYIEEGTNGYWNSDGNGGYYLRYEPRPQNITIVYNDGTTLTGTYDELWEQLEGEIYYTSDQNNENIWTPGTHTATLSLSGASVEYDVVITECQIESVTILPHILVANQDGWTADSYYDENIYEWVSGEWYQYNVEPQMITVTFKDGTTKMVDYEGLARLGYAVRLNHDQSYFNPWQAGVHTVTLQGTGFSATYDVEIVEQITSETSGHNYGVLSDGTAVLFGYNIGHDGDYQNVTIPETVDGYTVTVLGRYLLQYSGIESVSIPSTVKRIDRYAFYSCYSLKNIRLYVGVETIASYAFGDCPYIERIVFFGTEDEAATIDIFNGNEPLSNVDWNYATECVEHVYDDVCDAECNNCFETREPEHAFEWVIDYAGTCVSDGWKHEKCTLCEETRNWDTIIPATGEHANTEWQNGYDATCGNWGYTGNLYCTDCGTLIEYGTEIEPTGNHQNTDVTNVSDATCETDGNTGDIYCYDCNNIISLGEVIPATGHQNTEVQDAYDANCGNYGYTGNTYCYDCDRIIGTGVEIEPTGNHQNTGLVNNLPVSCTSDGSTGDLFCFDCGTTLEYGEVIPATGHQNTERVRVQEATCGSGGYTGDLYCHDCTRTLEVGEYTDPTNNHLNTETRDEVEATCSQEGYTGDLWCNDCGRVIQWGSEVPMKEHENTTLINVREASCGQTGYTGDLFCNDCGEIVEYGEEIVASEGHQNTYRDGQSEPTCGNPGYTGDLICNDCGEIVESGEEIPATGEHGTLTVSGNYEATCNAPGYTGDVVCGDCGTTVQSGQVIAATGKHVYDNGYDTDCNVCGEVREVLQNPPALSLNGGTAYQGDTIRVDISIEGNTGFAALQFGVLFDSTYLTLVNVESQMEDFFVTVGNSIVFDSYANHVSDGVIATLVFQVAEDAPVGEYNVQLRFMSGSNEDFEEVVMTDSATTITVESAVAGDANGDGKVNTSDLVMLRRYLASMDPTTMVSDIEVKKGADANEDGVIDALDLAYVRKYLASMSAT